MRCVRLQARAEIEAFLRRDPELHIYCLGDLDDFSWPATTWYGWEQAGQLLDVVLVYEGAATPTVVGISDRPDVMGKLLGKLIPLLPRRFHAHVTGGVEEAFRLSHDSIPHGTHYRMGLRDRSAARRIDCSAAVRLGHHDLDEVLRFYEESHPGNWFEEMMLRTGQYFGVRLDGRLVSLAGVHVYSEQYRVAAIGNVVTHPAYRNRGYGTIATARVCRSLLEEVDHIGLNVKTDNFAALACYRKLGFAPVASYEELTLERRR